MASKTFFPTLSPDRKRMVWFEVTPSGQLNQSIAPAGFAMPNIAALRLVSVVGGQDDDYAGIKLMTDGSMIFIEGHKLTDKMRQAVATPYWVRYRPGTLAALDKRGDPTRFGDERMHDIVYLSFRCLKCGKFKRPVDGIDTMSRNSWDMKCGECRAKEQLPNW